ncbi:uncharacterized protein LOC118698530 isoform X13 [Molothrus ater]|uniref:uncharacterized protein LOC118698530 isoform X13 n=1 Tax=Molothrus ater TaxID=84834 RepID=UPI0023E889A0|nr:uncharacterized protein LOC118698530 isoform X13 [Molothrus ater]
MRFIDGYKMSGALKLSCNSLTLVLTFFSDLGGLNLCQSAPSQVRYFPRAGTKSGYQQSRQSTWSAIQVAFGNGPGVATPPVTTASVSERARSVRPEQLSVLRSTLSKRHQPGASRSFPADKAAFLCSRDRHPQLCERCRRIKSRAEPPIPGAGIALSRKSRQRAAVKAEWARWSTCNLSWLSMTMPGAVGALGMPRNRGGQVSSGHPPESNQDLSLPQLDVVTDLSPEELAFRSGAIATVTQQSASFSRLAEPLEHPLNCFATNFL